MKMTLQQKRANILMTCAGGSATIYLANALKRAFNIFLVDASDQSVAPLLRFPFRVVPLGNSVDYIPEMKKLIREWDIDCIVPGADEELEPLMSLGRESDVIVVSPRSDFIRLCLNKKDLMTALDEHGISSLKPFADPDSVAYPAVAKPVNGRGSRGVHIVRDRTQLDGYLKLYGKPFSDVLVQRHVAGDEYTVSVIVNNRNRLIGIVPKKIILKRGITRAAVSEQNGIIESACRKIIEAFSPCGPFNVQLKLWNGVVYIFEINPRLSTTAVLTDRSFGNEVALFLRYHDQATVRCRRLMKEGVRLYRYEENVFA